MKNGLHGFQKKSLVDCLFHDHEAKSAFFGWQFQQTSNDRHFLLDYWNRAYNIPLESSWSLVFNSANLALMRSSYQKLWLKSIHLSNFTSKLLHYKHSFAHFLCRTSSPDPKISLVNPSSLKPWELCLKQSKPLKINMNNQNE